MTNLCQKTVVLFLGLTVLLTGHLSIARAEENRGKPLSVCTDSNGVQKSGALDIVLLMDNSRSLETTSARIAPTDPDGKRFSAVSDLLGALGRLTEQADDTRKLKINFGMISFGERAEIEIPLTDLTADNAQSLATEVRETLPPLQRVTNYVDALNRALNVLTSRPEQNCKFLIWFTDGQFEREEVSSRDTERGRKIAEQAGFLERNICEGGIADRFHESRINTFVLVLKPTNTDSRLDVSYGAMQAITGASGPDQLPKDVAEGKRPDICGNLASRDHLGDILVAEDASSIARKVPSIGNSIDGWSPVTTCPVTANTADMPRMPSARFLKGISFTAYEKGTELKSLENSRIVDSGGTTHDFSKYLVSSSSSTYEQKFTFNDEAITRLEQGWTFSITNGEVGWCIQILPHSFEVSFTSDTEQPVKEEFPGNFLTEQDIMTISYKKEDGTPLSLDAARSEANKVVGFLDIDPTQRLFREPIPVIIRQLKVPATDCVQIEFRADSEDMPKSQTKSASCSIDTSMTTLETVNIRLLAGSSLGSDRCNAEIGLAESEPGVAWSSDLATAQEIVHGKGKKSLHVVLQFAERSAECVSADEYKVLFEFGNGSDQGNLSIPVLIDLNLKKVPNLRTVVVLSIIALVIAAMLNLLIMRYFAQRSARMSRFGIDAYEIPVTLIKNSGNRVELRLRDGSSPTTFHFEIDKIIPIAVDANRRSASLRKGSYSKLETLPPPLFKPFGNSALVLANSSNNAMYWKSVAGRRGLSPLAQSGVIIHSPEAHGDKIDATATFIIPSSGLDRQGFIRETLGSRLTTALQDLLTTDGWFGSEKKSIRSLFKGLGSSLKKNPTAPSTRTSPTATRPEPEIIPDRPPAPPPPPPRP